MGEKVRLPLEGQKINDVIELQSSSDATVFADNECCPAVKLYDMR